MNLTNNKINILKDFLKNNKNFYIDYLFNDFKDRLFMGYTKNNDVINQIYCYLDLIDIKNTEYYQYYKYLQDNFNVNNKNILEVGCGIIPILANIIYEHNNKITLCESNVLINDNNLNIINDKFNINTNIDNYDFIYGFRPCMATESIIKNCLTNHKEFSIYTCMCALQPNEEYNNFSKDNWDYKKWHEYLIYIANKYNDGTFNIKIDYIKEIDECPIISAFKK